MSELADAESLMEEGFELLGQDDTEGAIKIGKRMKKMKHSSAFEILALAYGYKDKLPNI